MPHSHCCRIMVTWRQTAAFCFALIAGAIGGWFVGLSFSLGVLSRYSSLTGEPFMAVLAGFVESTVIVAMTVISMLAGFCVTAALCIAQRRAATALVPISTVLTCVAALILGGVLGGEPSLLASVVILALVYAVVFVRLSARSTQEG